ncbi:UNVERIFIED_CONTAM: hypothetical protein H355_009037 [Colinus virginianus]|nr:hypothetical protein H355_009037 [Colinus virginianus]
MNTAVSPPFLQLNKVHQNSILGNTTNLLLQSPAHLPLPQQQLMKMENIQANSKPGLLGEPPTMLLQTVLGIGHLICLPIQTAAAAAGMGLLPFFPNQHIVGQAIPGQNNAPDKALSAEGVVSGSQPYHQSVAAGALRAGHAKQQSQLKGTETSLGTPSKKQTSLLGEPPKEIRLSTNPYLNLASVLPGICLPGKQTFNSCVGKFPPPECGRSLLCSAGDCSGRSTMKS